MSNSTERDQCVKTLTGLIKDLRNVMLTTVAEGGRAAQSSDGLPTDR